MARPPSPDDPLVRRWVEAWQYAGERLEALRQAEIASVDTQEAVRQIFGGAGPALPPPLPTPGLIEQQAWFARLYRARGGR